MSRITRALLAGSALLALAAPASAAAAPALVPVGELRHADATSPRRRGDPRRLFVVERAGVIQAGPRRRRRSAPVPRHLRRRRHGTASAACSRSPSRPTTRRPGCSTSTWSRAEPAGEIQVREYRRSAANPDVADPAAAGSSGPRDAQRGDEPQRRPDRSSGRDGYLWLAHRRRRRRQRRHNHAQRPLEPARQGAADRPAPATRGELHGPGRQPVRHRGVGVRACATRSASRSTAGPATS